MAASQFPPVKHLLMDLDGTLLGAHEFQLRLEFATKFLKDLKRHKGWFKALSALRAIAREFKRPGLKLTEEFTNDKRIYRAFAERLGVPIDEGKQILDMAIGDLFPTLERHFFPVTGAKDFLDWASERYPMTLATQPVWSEEWVKLRLKWAGVDPKLFTHLTHAGLMHACKPSEVYYRQVMELVQKQNPATELKPENFLLVGDDLDNDLPATRVGIAVFILGKNRRIEKIKTSRAKAPAWRGTFESLRGLLTL